jgi:hypothetical protein
MMKMMMMMLMMMMMTTTAMISLSEDTPKTGCNELLGSRESRKCFD